MAKIVPLSWAPPNGVVPYNIPFVASTSGPLPLRDSFIGAIARSHGYRIVTRDVGPFERMGCNVLNPWQ